MSDTTPARPYPHLTDDAKRSLLVLLMEDIRGSFDLAAGDRTQAVIALADDLGYEQVAQSAREYAALDDYRDGRWFRCPFSDGGYVDPPFPVVRTLTEASQALIEAVEELCDYPEYRLEAEPVEKGSAEHEYADKCDCNLCVRVRIEDMG